MTRAIIDREFAKRLSYLCEQNANVPAHNYGRLSHIQRELFYAGIRVSTETVRKWFAGEARPRPDKMRALAKILNVSPPLLAYGEANVDPYEVCNRVSELETLMKYILRSKKVEDIHAFARAAFTKEAEETSNA